MAYINGQKILFSPKIQITGNGSGIDAILSVASLPTENISTTHFYRTTDGVFWWDGTKWHEVANTAELEELRQNSVEEIASIDTYFNDVTSTPRLTYKGITWTGEFMIESDELEMAQGAIFHRMPIVAGENVTFEVDEDNQVVKINAEGGSGGNEIVTTTGTGAAYEANVPSITELKAGVSFLMKAHVSNTSGSASLNVNGLGAKDIFRRGTDGSVYSHLSKARFIAANNVYRIFYDGARWILLDYAKPIATDLYGVVPVANGGVPTTGQNNAGKVLTTNSLGTPEWQTPSASGGTSDIVVPAQGSRGNANFVESVPGLVKLYNQSAGLSIDEYGQLGIAAATESDIDEGTSMRKPIVPKTMKYAMRENSFTGNLNNITPTHADAYTPAGALAITNFVLENAFRFKLYKIPRGGMFEIKPGMMALILPYGDYTLSLHESKTSSAKVSNMGATVVMATDWGAEEEDANCFWVACMSAKTYKILGVEIPTMGSNHTKYTQNCFIKNNDTGTSGTGYAYVYYISRGED